MNVLILSCAIGVESGFSGLEVDKGLRKKKKTKVMDEETKKTLVI